MRNVLAVVFGVFLAVTSGFTVERPHELSKTEVKALLAKASTPQDHLRLAGHYEAKAKKLEAESEEHLDMAKMYRVKPTGSEAKHPMAADTAGHCEFLAESLGKAAKSFHALAKAHEEMARK